MSTWACRLNGTNQYCYVPNPVKLDMNVNESNSNTGFETNLSNWFSAGNHSGMRITSDAHAGLACAEVIATGAGSFGTDCFYCGLSGVPAVGKTATIEFWAKSVSGNTTLKYDGSGCPAGQVTLTTSWQKFIINFQITSAPGSIGFFLNGAGTFRIDDVSFTEAYDFTILQQVKTTISTTARILSRQSASVLTTYTVGGKYASYCDTGGGTNGHDAGVVSNTLINDGAFHLCCVTAARLGNLKNYIDGLADGSVNFSNVGKLAEASSIQFFIGLFAGTYFNGDVGETVILRKVVIPAADMAVFHVNGIPSSTELEAMYPGAEVVYDNRWSGNDDATFLRDETGQNNLTGVNVTQAGNQVAGAFPTRSLAAIASGSASVLFGRAYQGQGGASASGSAPTAFGRVYQGGGSAIASGSAATAFGRVYSATGGAVASGHAPFGKVYNFKWEHGGPDFKVGDLLLARRMDYNKAANRVTLMEVRAIVQTIDAEGEANVEIISGSEYLPFFGVGIEVVRVGNKIDPNRRGSIYLTSDDVAAPFLDVIDEVDDFSKLGAASTIKARLGRLSGITDSNFGALTGYGLYTENAYLKGTIAGGAASAFMTGIGYHFDKLGNARFGNPTNGRYINFDVATGLVNIGSGVALQWASVTGTGKPADNATVGADWSTNVTGRPTNLVALGDIPGFIQSTYINSTEIKAPNITGNSILGGNIVASSGGTNTAGLTGEGSGDTAVRIWAGSTYANRASAPFNVTQAGALTAANATIKSSTGTKRIELRSSDNELEFFEAGASIVRIGSNVFGVNAGVYAENIKVSSILVLGEPNSLPGFLYFYSNLSSFTGVLTASVTTSRTWTLPDVAGTLITTGNLSAITAVGTIASGTWNGAAIAAAYLGSHSHAAGDITSGTLADARVAQSNITQHQAALSIAQSQITGAWGSGGSGTLWVSSNGSSFVGVGIGTINITIGGTTHNLLRAL